MKTIGLIGGMSWESTLSYYKLLNEGIKSKLGGFHSAQIVMISVDFAPIEELQKRGEWQRAGEILAAHALTLEKSGADFIVLCTNTMHKVADAIEENIKIPLLHIAEQTAKGLKKSSCSQTILLGTRFTMQEDFYKSVLKKHGIKVYTPKQEDIKKIDAIIFEELVQGKISPKSKLYFQELIASMQNHNKQIDSVILGCTEIGLLLKKEDISLKIFDTTYVHVDEALHYALSKQ